MSMIVSSTVAKPGSQPACRPAGVRTTFSPALPTVQRRKTSVIANLGNFKTRDTEAKVERSVPDADDLNQKANEYFAKIQNWWDKTEEKPAVVATGVAGFVVLWAVSGLVDRLDKLPFIGFFLELTGLIVTGWFTYRYLTFAPDREELKKTVKNFYGKVTGEK